MIQLVDRFIGIDHKKAMNIYFWLGLIEEKIAKQAGRNNMRNVFNIGPIVGLL